MAIPRPIDFAISIVFYNELAFAGTDFSASRWEWPEWVFMGPRPADGALSFRVSLLEGSRLALQSRDSEERTGISEFEGQHENRVREGVN